jgi:hypothetical protein
MPSISITIDGRGRSRTISAGDLNGRLLPALRYRIAAEPEPVVVDPIADKEMLEAWADAIIEDLKISVETYEDTNTKTRCARPTRRSMSDQAHL